MPFVIVRPRKFKNQNKRGSPFKIDVDKVCKAYAWLKNFNPYYCHVEWIKSAEEPWRSNDMQVGTVREEDFSVEDTLQITREALWVGR